MMMVMMNMDLPLCWKGAVGDRELSPVFGCVGPWEKCDK